MQLSGKTAELDRTATSSARSAYETTFSTLRGALRAFSRGDARGPELRGAMRSFCEDARQRGLRAEQLVVMLRHMWHSLPETRGVPGADERTGGLDRAVAICIDEYYGMPAGAGPEAAGAPVDTGDRPPVRCMDCGGDDGEPSALASRPARRNAGRSGRP